MEIKPEDQARLVIDKKLIEAGWTIQNKKRMNLYDGKEDIHGIAIREMDTSTGPVDYMLFVDGKACGIIEAKKDGISLGGVAEQSGRYSLSKSAFTQRWLDDLPFTYEASSLEVRFCDYRDPKARSRSIFHFHKPETLKYWLEEENTLRARMHDLPELNTEGLRDCQIAAITGIEDSLKKNKPRALLQMATGSGKTFTAVTQIYRLAKYAKAKRVLFLVDRGNLGRQAKKEFEQYDTPLDGRKFTSHYNVNMLGTTGVADTTKVTISTIQRLYSQLAGTELDDDADERSGYEIEANTETKEPRTISYNPEMPIETFDLIIIDECHRSIYNLWRQVIEYFDAFLIGLTATPTKKTIGFFKQNLVSEYTHEDAVIDKVNVGYDIYRIKTKKSEEGDLIEAGTAVQVRDRLTKKKRQEILDKDESYNKKQLDRSVISPNQILTVLTAFKDNCLPDCFSERTWVPKTLIFAKDDDHADRIVDKVREVFNEGNSFCKKVTYRVGKKAAEDTIAEFRTSPRLRVAVTVDMIATGTDIKPLECLIFMRDVRSQAYYEQMKGRGTRVIDVDSLNAVTPDAKAKTKFVLVDAVGVTETDKTESQAMEQKPSVSTEKLMEQIARGDRSAETIRSLGNRLIRLDLKIDDKQRAELSELMGKPLALVAGELIHATNEDYLEQQAKVEFGTDAPTQEQRDQVYQPLANAAIKPFHNPDVRETIEKVRRNTDQIIDESADELIDAGFDEEKAQHIILSFKQFIADNKAELTAIELIFSKPYQQRHLSYEQIEELAENIQAPPYNLAPIEVWKAYQQLETAKVKGVPPAKLLTNIVSLVTYATGLKDVLEPFPEVVERRFDNWLTQQQQTGVEFDAGQLEWLALIKEQIAQNAEMMIEDFDYAPFTQQGGVLKAKQLFGDKLNNVVNELNGYLIA
ncbi:type I restriction endonuclease subunit R [Pseudoalteromonas carrageenovora]|uniref:type I restriction endonuclease subunit R n=1 Tax=Pseudoalteromonas carrageenovora TaxID=227 RepID=UPI0026E31B4D|nr:DEAD/DEAH box helicase family protein [Pseudoalteromonas carrageenovora]MDO6465526.1 type I restriction-modification enzyme R subunit C-terminal domain-containing protein [Pseudoalteromonas carrageenovora]